MECKHIDEMIKRFYSDKNDIFLISHLSECYHCRAIIEIIKNFDKIKFVNEPSYFLDRNILLYASKNMDSSLFLYMIRKIYLTFAFSIVSVIFMFVPIKYNYNWESIDYKIEEFKTEFSEVSDVLTYEYNIDYDFSEINR